MEKTKEKRFELLYDHEESSLPRLCTTVETVPSEFETLGECLSSAFRENSLLANKDFDTDSYETAVIKFRDSDNTSYVIMCDVFILSQSEDEKERQDPTFYVCLADTFDECSDEEYSRKSILERSIPTAEKFKTFKDAVNSAVLPESFEELMFSTDGIYFVIKRCGRMYLYELMVEQSI